MQLREFVLAKVSAERDAQDIEWGPQNHPDGTADTDETRFQREFDKAVCEAHKDAGTLTWRDILQEEVSEAFAESDLPRLHAELIQVAAVAVKWLENLERRMGQVHTYKIWNGEVPR